MIWYSEIDDLRFETRKVGIFRDGSFGLADANTERGGLWLSEKPLPSFADIAAQSEFDPEAIDEIEFEAVWEQAIAHFSANDD